MKPTMSLLTSHEPPPFSESSRQGRSNFIIVVDHASARIPRRLATLGLPTAELERHIAWDIGALHVAARVAATLDATRQTPDRPLRRGVCRFVLSNPCRWSAGVPTVSWVGVGGLTHRR